jgi:hypothetical protein
VLAPQVGERKTQLRMDRHAPILAAEVVLAALRSPRARLLVDELARRRFRDCQPNTRTRPSSYSGRSNSGRSHHLRPGLAA